jgi:DNA uptake protein ComE-like DNA-binding protein
MASDNIDGSDLPIQAGVSKVKINFASVEDLKKLPSVDATANNIIQGNHWQ